MTVKNHEKRVRYLLQTSPELPVDDVAVRVLGQEVEQQLGLYLGQPAQAVRGDALLELCAREDALAVGVLALAKSLHLPHQAVELCVVECMYCLRCFRDDDGWECEALEVGAAGQAGSVSKKVMCRGVGGGIAFLGAHEAESNKGAT